MARKRKHIKDREEPGILEVRRWRAKLWKQGGGTLKGVMDMIRASQDAREAAGEAVVIRQKESGKAAAKKKRRAA